MLLTALPSYGAGVCSRERDRERQSDREREPIDDVDFMNCSGSLVEQVCVCICVCVCIRVCVYVCVDV